MYVDVAFPISQYQVFTYAVLSNLLEIVDIGVRVRAPIGKRILPGVIVGVKKTTDFKGKIRTISEIIDEIPIFDESLWKLIQWISNYYITPIGKAATVIPKHLSDKYKPQERWYVRSTC